MTTDADFMEQAIKAAKTALSAGEFPVGCVIADKKHILATGFRQGTAGPYLNEIDHAEIITLRHLSENQSPKNTPENMDELSLFCTMEPCLMCFGAILLSGIKRIVYAYEDVMGGGTRCDLSGLPKLYKDANIMIVPHVLRRQSLELFKAFFSNPENKYWKNSLLAEYTLAQE
jgi:tRNA(adenine34) deaminase